MNEKDLETMMEALDANERRIAATDPKMILDGVRNAQFPELVVYMKSMIEYLTPRASKADIERMPEMQKEIFTYQLEQQVRISEEAKKIMADPKTRELFPNDPARELRVTLYSHHIANRNVIQDYVIMRDAKTNGQLN